jgi:hypothetical protein
MLFPIDELLDETACFDLPAGGEEVGHLGIGRSVLV